LLNFDVKFKFSHPQKAHPWLGNTSFDVLIDTSSLLLYATTMRGKGKYTKLFFSYAICGTDTPGLISINKIWRACCTSRLNQNIQFCNKIFRGFRSTGGQNPVF